MKDKIEVGEYVRTKSGIIFKFEWFEKNDYCPNFELGEKGKSFEFEDEEELKEFMDNDIVKHSKNIKDLIEEGDYVNGHKVIFVGENEIQLTTDIFNLDVLQIKTIVTKEQFARVEYKI